MDNFPLTPFLEQLATAGLKITVQDYRRINRVLSLQGAWRLERVQTVLSSLLTHSTEQQLLFNEQFQQYFKSHNTSKNRVDVEQWNRELSSLLVELSSKHSYNQTHNFTHTYTQNRDPVQLTQKVKQKRQWQITALVLSIIVLLGIAASCQWTSFCSPTQQTPKPIPASTQIESKEPVEEASQAKTETVTITTKTATQVKESLPNQFQPYWHWLSIFSSLFSLLLLFLWWQKRRPPKVEIHTVDPTLPDKYFDESKIGGVLPPLLSEHERDQLADLVSYTQSDVDSKQLDIHASIKASSQSGGVSQLRFHKRKQLQGILILDDANAIQKHWNTLAKEWANALKARGIPCTYGTYHNTPEHFISEQGEAQHLEDWEDQKHQLIFCLFSDTHQASTLKQFDWHYWDNISVFSYQENRYWDERETQLQSLGLRLFPATKQSVFDVLQKQTDGNGGHGKQSSNTHISRFSQHLGESDISYLQRNLGASLAWAEACCLYAGAFSVAAAEWIRQQHFPEINFLQIQRFVHINGTWTGGKQMEFAPRVLIALRQSFAKRDKAWQKQIISTWQDLLDASEPKDKQSLSWQHWAWKKYRLLMQWDSDTGAKKLHELAQSYPKLMVSMQAELRMASLESNDDTKIPLPTPRTETGKKHLYALAKRLYNQGEIQVQTIHTTHRWQLAGALLMGAFAISSVVIANWQIPQTEAGKPFSFDMVTVPKGTFKMGCVSGVKCQSDEQPVHDVNVPAFMMSATEVTNQQYVHFLNATEKVDSQWLETKLQDKTSHILKKGNSYAVEASYENHPAINISWFGAKAYLAWLSQKTGHKYRLPSEAEWEYAARAGTQTAYWWGNNITHNNANYGTGLAGKKGEVGEKDQWTETAPVAQFEANTWGLYDTAGNVWEWVEDCWHSDYSGNVCNGQVFLEGF